MTSSKNTPKGQFRNVPAPQGGRQASVYSRFIPREELNDFAAWTPGTLDGDAAAAAPSVRAAPRQAAAAPPPPPPNAQDELQAMLNATRQQAYQDGYRDGLVALDAFKQSHARQVASQIGMLLQSTTTQLDELQQKMARVLAVSATNLARQIIRTELQTSAELVAMVAAEALDTLLLSARHITVRVHPDDQPLVEQGAAEVLAARGGRVVADSGIARGGCLVESDIGSIDATMEARWRRATAALGCDGPWHDEEAIDATADGSSGSPARQERRAA
ncbi:FliH/SctL family protein [Piscinibacter sakaiensis]|uniref:FliH/SctL family protein n=1 Tax=Piscinibacter sakaiensis TaxID=1547922 RepID=UPI003AAF8DD3